MPPPSPATPNRATPLLIVMNARSGAGDADEARQQIRTVLETAGQAHEFLLSEQPDDIPAIAKRAVARAQANGGAIVAAGGDGTINAIAHAVLPNRLAFGIIPQGTFNYSGRAHGIPLEAEAAARALLDARLKPIQVGTLNDRIFLVNASLGLYPQLLQDREEYKRQFGRTRAVALLAGLRSLMTEHRQLSLEIEHDSERELIRTPTLFVGNNPLQLEQIGLPEADDVQRRKLAAIIVRTQRPGALLWLALRGALGRLADAQKCAGLFLSPDVRASLARRPCPDAQSCDRRRDHLDAFTARVRGCTAAAVADGPGVEPVGKAGVDPAANFRSALRHGATAGRRGTARSRAPAQAGSGRAHRRHHATRAALAVCRGGELPLAVAANPRRCDPGQPRHPALQCLCAHLRAVR